MVPATRTPSPQLSPKGRGTYNAASPDYLVICLAICTEIWTRRYEQEHVI